VTLLLAFALLAADAQDGPCSTASIRAYAPACDAAISAEADPKAKAQLYYDRAWSLNELHRPEGAIADLGRAVALDPDNPDFLHERAYALGEIGEFEAALRDLDREVALRPDSVQAFRERTFARLAAGDLEGAYRDSARIAELDPDTPDAHLLKAERALWLGRFDEAKREVDVADRLAKGKADSDLSERLRDARSAVALWRTVSGAASPGDRCKKAFETAAVTDPNVIGDCTSAFFAAPTAAKKAEYLTYRSVMWSAGQQDEARMLIDAEVAAAIDPSDPDMLVNVAGVYDRLGRYRAALTRLDRALAAKPSYAAFAARAVARYGLGDKAGAFADGKKSFEIHPNLVALTLLGDLAHDRGDDKSAKLYWMGAWHLGMPDDGLRDRLKRIGVEDPDKEPKP
jgi:tetratricopeptide (TPR) repeat protein